MAALQWGRDQLIAEIKACPTCAGSGKVLQWGRDQLIAEILAPGAESRVVSNASMGPRSADRGNEFFRGFHGHDPKLQWGRDQLIAEMAT